MTNTRGITSEWSAPRFTDVSGYGTWRVSGAANAAARTYGSDTARLSFDYTRPDTRTYYGSTRFSVTVKYDGKPIMTDSDVSGNLYYRFDRGTDGYPERHENAAGGIRDLSLYSFTVRPVETITGEIGEDVEVPMDETGYGTWLIPEVSATAEASEHLVLLRWNLDGEIPYGTMRYDVLLGGEAIKENLSSAYFAYRFAENLSAEEAGALEFSVRARNEAHEKTAALSVDTSGYLGYKVQKPWIKATARKEGIDVSWDRTNDFYGKAEFVLLKDGEEVFRGARERSFFLPFGEDEFPEKDDILAISLQVRLEGDADSATSDAAETDVSGYLTHMPAVPKTYPSASGRNASLSWDAQDRVYDFTGCEIQVAKAYKAVGGKMTPVTDAEELEWYAPALGLNPYESLENYKRGEAGGFLEVRGLSVSFTMPLFGQDGEGASDTPYAFRLRGRSAAGRRSEWTEAAFVVCKAVSAYDVTRAWDLDDNGEKVKLDGALGVQQIFAEELSAISANLGYITDGAMRGNEYNYWAVGDVPMEDGSTMWRGSFRVGGKDQYILVEPRLKDGAPTGEYDITFVVGNYSVSATGTQIRNGSFEVLDEDGNLMFGANADGSKTSVETGRYFSTVPVIENEEHKVSFAENFTATLWEHDGEAYMAHVARDTNPNLAIIIRKAEISQGEFKFTAQKSIKLYQGYTMLLSLACAKQGRVVFLYVNFYETSFSQEDSMIKFIEYDTASNNFSQTTIAQEGDALYDEIKDAYNVMLTDYGLVYYRLVEDNDGYKEYELVYVGKDGKTAVLEKTGWRGSQYSQTMPMFRDEEDELYAIIPVMLNVLIVRLNKANMTAGTAALPLISMQTLDSAGTTADPMLAHEFRSYRTHPRIVDGRLEFIAMCTLILTSDNSERRGFGARLVSVPLGGIAWGAGTESPAVVRPTVYDWKPALQSADVRALLTAGFGGGKDFVLPVAIGAWRDPITGNVTPQHLEEHRFRVDDSVPDLGYDMMDYREGALKNEKICDVDAESADDMHFGERIANDSVRQCAVTQNGGRRIFVSSFYQNSDYSYPVRLAAFYDGEGSGSLEKKPMVSGVGFFRVLHDLDTGRYRYYLDPATGISAVLEFDKDGKLLATKGDKGSPGDKGDKGEKGERGDAPVEEITEIAQKAAWPEGLMCVTKDTSHNPGALLGGNWESTKVTISLKTYYLWERKS